MAASTGPILALGAVTIFNDVIVHGKTLQQDTRVIVGTGIAAVCLAFLEHLSEGVAVALAWAALTTAIFVRVDPKTPSPVESFMSWYNGK